MKSTTCLDRLRAVLAPLDRVLIAFSGGVDSTLLLRVARDLLGPDRVVAVVAESPIYQAVELAGARDLAREMGVEVVAVQGGEMADPCFVANPPERCYHCKGHLFRACWVVAEQRGIGSVLDGSNRDDLDDYRPGSRAGRELGVRSPLQEAGLTKPEIRELSRQLGLPTWDRPAMPCLATRLPYGMPVTVDRLERVGSCERGLARLGFRQFRARLVAGEAAMVRLEIAPDEMARALEEPIRGQILTLAQKVGFRHVTLDLRGYRMGSLNETLPPPDG